MQQLSKREIRILLQLLDTEASLTTKELADNHQVSVRTIKYDLDHIRDWLKDRQQTVCSKRNKGIWMELSDSKRLELKNELMSVERFELYPDQEIRLSRLILIMLLAESALTSQELANKLGVSKNTIINDIDQLETTLAEYQVLLQRQNRQGFSLKGSEKQLRLVMEYVCQRQLTDYDINQIMTQLLHQEKRVHDFFKNFDENLQAVYQQILTTMGELLRHRPLEEINYAEILSMTLRVAIAVVRMQNGFTMNRYKLLTNQQFLAEQQELPYLLMKSVFDLYELPLLEDEYLYIYSDAFEKNEEQDILTLTEELIRTVSQELELPFDKDTQLFTDLFAHLSLRLSRKQKFINEYNPFLDDIKAKYPKLFAAIKKASQEQIDGSALLINDSFIAYIALHFLVSYEKEQERKVVRLVYICSTGLGVTNLIQQRVREELHNVEIASFASILNAKEIIAEKDPDLVISIFPIEGIDRRFIKVHPLPTEKDIEQIREEVKKILEQENKRPRLVPRKTAAAYQSAENLSRDVIVKGYIIYEELLQSFDHQLTKEYQEAFLLHVFLMVHRIIFDQQYENDGNIATQALLEQKELVGKIETVFSNNDLSINRAEISALLNYSRKEITL